MSSSITIVAHDPTVEQELGRIAGSLGADLPAYRNHVYRVLTYALHFLNGDETLRQTIAFALAYHDAGLWTAGDLAYLAPSEALAERMRATHAPDLDAALVHGIIHWHHKATAYRGPGEGVINAVRRADWVDATEGRIRKGLPRAHIAAVTAAIPVLGFPDVLMRLAAELNGGNKAGGLWRVISRVYKL